MTLSAQILADLEIMMADWDDTSVTGGSTINILFDNEYVELVGTGSASPAALARTSDVPNAKKGDVHVITSVLCNITSVSYTVDRAEKNPADGGPGTTRLFFKKT